MTDDETPEAPEVRAARAQSYQHRHTDPTSNEPWGSLDHDYAHRHEHDGPHDHGTRFTEFEVLGE